MSTKANLHNQLEIVINRLKKRQVDDQAISKLNLIMMETKSAGLISDDFAMDVDVKVTHARTMIQSKSGEIIGYGTGLFPTIEVFQKADDTVKELAANRFVNRYSPTSDGPNFALVHKDKAIDYLALKLEEDLDKLGIAPPGTATRRVIEWIKLKGVEVVQQVTISVVVAVLVVYLT